MKDWLLRLISREKRDWKELKRFAVETDQQREERLERMNTCQFERLAAETDQQRRAIGKNEHSPVQKVGLRDS